MEEKNYTTELFTNYADIVTPKELKEMLGNKIGTNKIYKLLKSNEIYNKRIGNNYFIPKTSVIEYLMQK